MAKPARIWYAQVLAEGGAIPEKDMASEHVRQDAFLNEAQRLLEDALSTNASLQRALEEDDWCAICDPRAC